MTRCIAVIGPSAVGKSELIDQMAMLEGKRPPAAPPVDLRCAEFSYLGENWVALDCPGSLEFAQIALDAILCADAVVIVASPDPEQAVLAAPWIRLAETGNVPRFFFVNRIDECRHDARGIMSAIQSYSTRPIILRQVPIRDGERVVGAVDLVSDRAWRYRDGEPSELIEVPDDLRDRQAEGREELLESLSEHDDWLLEEIIEDRTPATGAVYGICARTLAENLTVPAFFGSAATGNGIRRLMKALRHEAPQPNDTRSRLNDASAAAFMSRTRMHVGKLVWLRSFADELRSGATVGGGSIGGLVEPVGERPAAKASIDAGGVASAVKSDHLDSGCLYSETGQIESPEWYKAFPALWNRTISAVHDRDDAKLSEALHQIAAEDLSLTVIHDQESGQVVLGSQGSQHLRRIQQTLSEIFGVETDTGPFVAHYRETITQKADIHYRH